MANKFKRSLTTQEASLIATGLEKYGSLKDARAILESAEMDVRIAEGELTNPYNDEGIASMSWQDIESHDEDYANLTVAEEINEALLEEVVIACQWHDYLTGDIYLYNSETAIAPQVDTLIEIFQMARRAPDDEYSYYPVPERVSLTKVSLAKWFEANLPEKANLFDPTENYKNINTGYSLEKSNKQVQLDVVSTTSNSQIDFSEQIVQTETWQNLYKLSELALNSFDEWRQTRAKPHSIPKSHIDEWLTTTLNATKREAETIKKVLVEIYNL